MFCTVWGWVAFAAWSIGNVLCWVNYRQLRRRNRKLDAELMEYAAELEQLKLVNEALRCCAFRSFLYQHVPAWRAWADAFDQEFTISVGPRKGMQ
jgi:hypothetical protein